MKLRGPLLTQARDADVLESASRSSIPTNISPARRASVTGAATAVSQFFREASSSQASRIVLAAPVVAGGAHSVETGC